MVKSVFKEVRCVYEGVTGCLSRYLSVCVVVDEYEDERRDGCPLDWMAGVGGGRRRSGRDG